MNGNYNAQTAKKVKSAKITHYLVAVFSLLLSIYNSSSFFKILEKITRNRIN